MFRPCFQHLAGIERKRIPPTPSSDLRLHRLERPEPWPPQLVDALYTAAKWEEVQQYPDYVPLYERLSEFIGVSTKNIVVGAGIENFVRDLVMLCCDPGDKVVFTYPTCAMFDIYARVFGAEVVHIETDPAEPPTWEHICKAITKGVKLVILPNPGQPVDVVYDDHALAQIAQKCRQVDAVLAIDEAYQGFGAPTAIPMVFHWDNMVVLRTFSKLFGAASIRVGYAVGHKRVIAPLDAVRQSGEVSGPSLRAALIMLEHWDHVAAGAAEIAAARNWLRDSLRCDGYRARGEYANHVLIDMGDAETARNVAARLAEVGVRVRVNDRPCDAWLMVTCGSMAMMKEFKAHFSAVME